MESKAHAVVRSALARPLVGHLGRFATVGAAASFADLGLFNVLRAQGVAPLAAKALSTLLGVTIAFIGNRQWTFDDRAGGKQLHRQYCLFGGVNVLGLGIVEVCLGVSHYLLGLTTGLADNLSANVVGLVLSSAFRFHAYRSWVFPPLEPRDAPPDPARASAPARAAVEVR